MTFTRYPDADAFAADALELLLENEVQNNLPISFIGNRDADRSNWLFATVKDASGGVALSAACTPPFNIVLYETRNRPNDQAVRLLSDELKHLGFTLPGVIAEQGLARRFAEAYTKTFRRNLSMHIMRLDRVTEIAKAPGAARSLRESDMFYTPYWEVAFRQEAGVEENDLMTCVERTRTKVGDPFFYIWEDGHPVSQAANWRNTQNGAVVNFVYTPPHYRGKGYASSVVAALSQALLDHGNQFCCLFADAENPISCGIYRKLGYVGLCVYESINFDEPAARP